MTLSSYLLTRPCTYSRAYISIYPYCKGVHGISFVPPHICNRKTRYAHWICEIGWMLGQQHPTNPLNFFNSTPTSSVSRTNEIHNKYDEHRNPIPGCPFRNQPSIQFGRYKSWSVSERYMYVRLLEIDVCPSMNRILRLAGSELGISDWHDAILSHLCKLTAPCSYG